MQLDPQNLMSMRNMLKHVGFNTILQTAQAGHPNKNIQQKHGEDTTQQKHKAKSYS